MFSSVADPEISLKIGTNFFLQLFKTKIINNFEKYVAILKGITINFFRPPLLLLFLNPGSGMGKNQDPGSGINTLDPQHWYLDCIALREIVEL
jgi:hypothetical protein